MQTLRELVSKRCVDHPVPLHGCLALEGLRNNINREVGLSVPAALRSHGGVVPVLPGIIADPEL